MDNLLSRLGTGHYLSPGGERRIQGGIRWLSEELRGGSAVIDRRKGGIRPNNCSCCSGFMRRKYHYRYHLHIKTVICRWLGEDGGGGE